MSQDNRHWWTSDLHLGHRGILEYTERGKLFTNMDDHDEWVIRRINTFVGVTDTLYITGDISFRNKWETGALIEQIEAKRKILILGNHDHDKHAEFYKTSGLFAEVYDHRHMTKIDGVNIVMDHFPNVVWNKSQYGAWMLHGHLHGSGYGESLAALNKRRILDVGLDNSIKALGEYRPFSFGDVRRLIGNNELSDHHNLT